MPSGTITALRAQEHDSQRVNVFISGEFAIGVSLNTIAREDLFVGKALDDEGWARLQAAEQYDKALQIALRALDARPRSTAELRERLKLKEIPPASIDAALTRLTELGLIDDAAFARFWVENRQIVRPKGVQALRDELRRKGVDRTVVDHTLADEELVGDDSERAWTLARSAMRKYASAPNKLAFQRRLGGFLQRRGFGFDVIRPILDTLWAEVRDGSADDEDNEDYEEAP